MERLPAGFAVPLNVEIKTGRTWAECKRALVAEHSEAHKGRNVTAGPVEKKSWERKT